MGKILADNMTLDDFHWFSNDQSTHKITPSRHAHIVELPHPASPTKHDDDLVIAIHTTFLNSSERRVKVFTRYVFA